METEESLQDCVPLTWRELAMLGASPLEAMKHRNITQIKRAKEGLRMARRKLETEGYQFECSVSHLKKKHKQEYERAYIRSNWGARIRPSQVYGNVWKSDVERAKDGHS